MEVLVLEKPCSFVVKYAKVKTHYLSLHWLSPLILICTDKTYFTDVLHNFANENFQYTKSILVCGMNNTLVDNLAEMVLPKIKNIGKDQ